MPKMYCKLCRGELGPAGEICEACRDKLGLTSGEAVRPHRPCARCGQTVLIRALVRELTIEKHGEYNTPQTVPMGVTYAPIRKVSFWSGDVGTEGAEPSRPLGILEMYVCRGCGFTEWYCRDPHEIPIGDEFGTEQIDVSGKTPYR